MRKALGSGEVTMRTIGYDIALIVFVVGVCVSLSVLLAMMVGLI